MAEQTGYGEGGYGIGTFGGTVTMVWDDTKATGDDLTAGEWNTHVDEHREIYDPATDELNADQALIGDSSQDPTSNGMLRRNGTDLKAFTGGGVVNLSNIGSGGGAPTDAEYHVNSADGDLSAETVFPINLGSPSDGQVLKYNGTSGDWEPATDQTASGGSDLADLAAGNIVYIGEVTGRQTLDPGTTNAPVFDAIEAIYANNEGGVVYLPPGNIDHVGGSTPSGRDQGWIMRPGISVKGFGGQNPNRFATTVTRTSAGDLVGWGTDSNESVVTTGANLSGLVVEMDYQNLSNATGRALVFSNAGSGTYNNWVQDLRIENVGDAAIMQDANTYATTFGTNLNVRRADPDNASSGRAIVQFTSGGVGHSFNGTCELYGHTSPASGTVDMLGMNLSGGWALQDMRFGGHIMQPLQHAGRELVASRLYAEPNASSSVTVPWMFSFDEDRTSSAGGGVHVGDISIGDGGDLTVSSALIRCTGFSSGSFGPAELPYVADRSSLVNNGVQLQLNDDVTGGVIYRGPVSEVDNNTGSNLSNPVICLADVTKKISTGVGFDGGTEDSQL